jgi:hypothetical protein
MSKQRFIGQVCRASSALALASILWLASAYGPPAALRAADEDKADNADRTAAGKSVSPTATLLRRESPGKPWQVVAENEAVPSHDLVLGMLGAVVESNNGAVGLRFVSDPSGTSPFPVIETVVQFHHTEGVDMDVTLDRGRVDLINRKQSGAAHARIHIRSDSWDLTLAEPGATIAVEVYGRWPRGVPFSKNPGPKDVPTASAVFLVLKGQVGFKHGSAEYTLHAPPGPALMEWDSVTGQDESPVRLEKLPPWAEPAAEETQVAIKKKELLERFRKARADKPVVEVLEGYLNSDDPSERRLAVYGLAALDELGRLGNALRETKHLDVWENGVVALRHWIGRKPGQDQILFKRLQEVSKYTPVQAETVMQLLHSYGENELAQPETYQTLIDYLEHDKLAIRGLAYWHLMRLVPAGKELGYSPLAPKEEREAAVQKWRKLLPPGKLPERPKADGANQ